MENKMKITNLLFRNFRLWPSLLLLPFTFAYGQTTDLSIRFIGAPDRVGIGEAFAIQAEVFHVDANSSAVVGEDVTATVQLIDPYGITISTHVQR